MNVRNRNIIFVIVLLFVVSALAESNIGLEFKIGSSIKDDILPLGFSGRLNFPIEKSNLKWGFDAGLVIISNWEDTLDLRNSDTPSDTLTYDYWTNTGTDLVLPLGVNFAYNMDFNQDFELIFEVGLGPLFRISSYTDIKSANDPPPKREISVTDSETNFYIKPRVQMSYKKAYLAYEYYTMSEFLEHEICLGITF